MHQNASFQHQNPTNYSLLQNVLCYCLYSFRPISTKFSKLILRKFIKIVAKRRQILRPKCTKFDVGWVSAPELTALPQIPLLDLGGPTSKGRRGVEGKEREGQNHPKKNLATGLPNAIVHIPCASVTSAIR